MRSTSLDTCCTRSEMAQPCCGPTESVLQDEEVECALREVDVRWQQCVPLMLLQEVIRHLL